MKHINEESHPAKCSDDAYDMILVDFHGRLANNLFEVAFAKRIAEQLFIVVGGLLPFQLSRPIHVSQTPLQFITTAKLEQ